MRKKMVSHIVVLIVLGYSSFQDVNAQVSIDSLLYKAECDDTAALIALGDAYMYGMGVEKNTSKSVVWYKKATKLGSSEAPRKLADYYATSSWPNNYVKYYKLAAERGDVIAQVKLADLYMADDFHTNKSAAKWYLRAAENGHAEAQSNIGWMYIHGKGVKRDREEGIKWYKNFCTFDSFITIFIFLIYPQTINDKSKIKSEKFSYYTKYKDEIIYINLSK